MAKKSSSEDIETSKRFKKEVKVKITADEVTEKDHQIRKNLTKVANLEEDMRPLKEKIAKLLKDNKQLRLDCETETEDKTMYVVNEFHFKRNEVLVKRDDNGEVVEKRTMTDEEKQEFMPEMGVGRGLKSVPEDEGEDPEPN